MARVIGVDVGSTTTKVALVETSPHPRELVVLDAPTPARADALLATVGLLLQACGEQTDRPVAAIGISSMAETGVALDAEDRALTPLLRWDAAAHRRTDLAAVLQEDPDVARRTGVPATVKPTRIILQALRRERPDAFARLRRWSGVADLVATALTGARATDHTLAARTMLVDRGTVEPAWSAESLGRLDLTPAAMPRILAPAEPAGSVSAEGAAFAGLSVGVPVHIAGHDHAVGGWGAGVREPGDQLDSLGTAEAVMAIADGASPDAVADGFALGRTVDGRHDALLGGSPACGALLSAWPDHPLAELAAADPGAWRVRDAIVLPYPDGRQCPSPDADAGVQTSGSPDAGALLQSLVLHAQWMRAALAGHAGAALERIALVGSLARRIPVWGPLVAAASDVAVRRSSASEPVAAAAALLAAVRAGLADPEVVLDTVPVAACAAPGIDLALRRFRAAALHPTTTTQERP